MSGEEWEKLTSYEKLNYRISELDLSEGTLNELWYETINVTEEILDLEHRINKAIEYTKQFINGKTSSIDEWENVELVLETIVQLLQGEE